MKGGCRSIRARTRAYSLAPSAASTRVQKKIPNRHISPLPLGLGAEALADAPRRARVAAAAAVRGERHLGPRERRLVGRAVAEDVRRDLDLGDDVAGVRVGVGRRVGRRVERQREAAVVADAAVDRVRVPVPNSNLQIDFNVSVRDSFDATASALLRELDESNRFVQKSAESTSI